VEKPNRVLSPALEQGGEVQDFRRKGLWRVWKGKVKGSGPVGQSLKVKLRKGGKGMGGAI